jgi:RimJ/RimL family protein N-acetyltransferase
MVTLAPFPLKDIRLLWEWLLEEPACNFDDNGPTNIHELLELVRWRINDGELLWETRLGNNPVGAVGYRQLDPDTGVFRGIVFARSVHGKGIAKEAVSKVLKTAFDSGTKIVRAEFFASNKRIQRFLEKLGGTVSDYITCGSMQNGIPIDWKVIDVTDADFHRTMHESRDHQIYIRSSSGVRQAP